MKIILLIVLGLGLLDACITHAATNVASSLSLDSVQNAVDAAHVGDVVKLPAGNATWNGTLNLNKAVWLLGSGTNATKIVSPAGTTAITYTGGPAGKPRISHLYIDLGNFSRNDHTAIMFDSENRQFRVDHCRIRGGTKVIWARWYLNYGVIDHNEFYDSDGEIYPWYNLSDYGATSWTMPMDLGTTNTIVVEDNLFWRTSGIDGEFTDETLYGQEGARVTFRRNRFRQDTRNTAAPMVDAHGAFGDIRGSTLYEIYQNYFSCDNTYRCFNLRGGTHIVWSNVFSGNLGSIFQLKNEGVSTYGQFDSRDRIQNSHFWGNVINGLSPAGQGVDIEGGSEPYVVKDEHYFTRSPKSGDHYAGYRPLVYPHPLVTSWGGGVPPIEPPVEPPVLGLSFNASEGVISSPFMLANGAVSQSVESGPTDGGKASYRFSVTNTGDYTIAITVSAPSGGANSCFVSVDAEPLEPDNVFDAPVNTAFVSVPVSLRGSSLRESGTTPTTWPLIAGTHTLIVRGREKDFAFKHIVVSPKTTTVPPEVPPVSIVASNANFRIFRVINPSSPTPQVTIIVETPQ